MWSSQAYASTPLFGLAFAPPPPPPPLSSSSSSLQTDCSPPVVPIPYTGRDQLSTYGYMATFRVAAYDPDAIIGQGNEAVTFHFADFMKADVSHTSLFFQASS